MAANTIGHTQDGRQRNLVVVRLLQEAQPQARIFDAIDSFFPEGEAAPGGAHGPATPRELALVGEAQENFRELVLGLVADPRRRQAYLQVTHQYGPVWTSISPTVLSLNIPRPPSALPVHPSIPQFIPVPSLHLPVLPCTSQCPPSTDQYGPVSPQCLLCASQFIPVPSQYIPVSPTSFQSLPVHPSALPAPPRDSQYIPVPSQFIPVPFLHLSGLPSALPVPPSIHQYIPVSSQFIPVPFLYLSVPPSASQCPPVPSQSLPLTPNGSMLPGEGLPVPPTPSQSPPSSPQCLSLEEVVWRHAPSGPRPRELPILRRYLADVGHAHCALPNSKPRPLQARCPAPFAPAPPPGE
ncbi:PREDICTED: vegetative cell wall protein gp1-like [Calidris pugnax]|uniref:vegetative cell wall protein gp1-like n=1 Tax=Calidris pugnax TaxID=198806 RepID=UPI00071C4ABA|nr:PREDICTED: vegetative cell wall protein gp1-like [Calidris pugnax]